MRKVTIGVGVLLLSSLVLAQTSTSFKLAEHVFNAGGHPEQGTVLTSASFQVTLDAIGHGVTPAVLTGVSYIIDGGFVGSFPLPGEVENLHFTDATTLVWDVDGSIGDYALYQGSITTPFDADYGSCQQPPPPITTETVTVTATPSEGEALFFLVTARNRLSEEGTKGFDSSMAERSNLTPCP